jgi:hypothetical protein
VFEPFLLVCERAIYALVLEPALGHWDANGIVAVAIVFHCCKRKPV